MADLHTINLNDIDFLTSEIDDGTLSQVCDQMEKEEATFEELQNLSLSQMLAKYDDDNAGNETEHEEKMEDLLMCQMLGKSDNIGDEFNDEDKMDVLCDMNFNVMTNDAKIEFLNPPVQSHITSEKQRFANPVSDEDITELLSNQENINTKKNTRWATRVFEMWRQNRNSIRSDRYIPDLAKMTTEEMNFFLGRFVVEARKMDGEPYPPRSLYLIVCGLLRYLRDENVLDKNFLDTSNLLFSEFRKILDARMKELLKLGYGTKTKQAEPLLPENEAVLWDKGVFGDSSSESLQSTVFFYACKLFALRGHDEHHDLYCEQFTVGTDDIGKYVQFDGRSSKTYKGGLKNLELANKSIRHHCQEGKINIILILFFLKTCRIFIRHIVLF